MANGSGYIGKHGPDFLLTGDQASQILNLRYGPDGNAWMIDWYDMQACHRREVNVHDRSNGRIYKISYGESADFKPVDLTNLSDVELAEQMLNANDWYVRHARRLLQERSAERSIDSEAINKLIEIAANNDDDTRRLRAAWALHVTGHTKAVLAQLLGDRSQYVRGWAVQLAVEVHDGNVPAELVQQFAEMARRDESQVVRLYLASAAQIIPAKDRWQLLEGLTSISRCKEALTDAALLGVMLVRATLVDRGGIRRSGIGFCMLPERYRMPVCVMATAMMPGLRNLNDGNTLLAARTCRLDAAGVQPSRKIATQQ